MSKRKFVRNGNKNAFVLLSLFIVIVQSLSRSLSLSLSLAHSLSLWKAIEPIAIEWPALKPISHPTNLFTEREKKTFLSNWFQAFKNVWWSIKCTTYVHFYFFPYAIFVHLRRLLQEKLTHEKLPFEKERKKCRWKKKQVLTLIMFVLYWWQFHDRRRYWWCSNKCNLLFFLRCHKTVYIINCT